MNNSKIKRKGDLNSYQVEREEHDWKYHATVFVYITSPHTKHLGNKIDCINDVDNDDADDDDDDDGHDNVDDDNDIPPY